MNVRSSWLEEFWRIVLLIAAALLVGLVFERVTLFLLLALLAYTLRNLYNLYRLARWLGDPQMQDIPIHFGLWGDIYSRIARVAARQAQREARLTNLVNEYAASTAALPDATVALDADGRIRWFNDAASRLLGLQAAKDVGQPLRNLFRSPGFATFLAGRNFQRSLQTNAPGPGERKLELRLAPYNDGQMLLLAQDVTDRVMQERVRTDFVANVSHELRTPLTVISGFVENLQGDESIADGRIKRPLELMAQQTERMRQIVEDLLLLARLESQPGGQSQTEVDIGAMLDLVAGEGRAIRADAPKISCEATSSRKVRGDEKQLRSALTNLVVNAVHHTPADGLVTLTWKDAGAASVLEVRDTGEGIEAEHIPRLTERFYRVDTGRSRERGGTGLGLAIVKHVLKRHHAELEILSLPGEGSRFICRFHASGLVNC